MLPILSTTDSSPTPVVAFDERALLSRHVAGDKGAFRVLINKFSNRIYGYLVRSGVPASERDDLFQDIFFKVHRSAVSYSADQPLSPWIFTIVVNTTRSHLRKVGVRKVVEPIDSMDHIESTIVSAARLAEAKETAIFMQDEVMKLSASQRDVLLLCAVQGLGQSEVATVLEMPLATVKTHLRRARIALAAAIGRRKKTHEREVGQ
jgi:RNA polymerase sigma-70 factor (ECF subfamily)